MRGWLGAICWLVGAGAALADDALSVRGYAYRHEVDPSGPVSIHVFQVARSHPELRLTTTLGTNGQFGVATVARQVRGLPNALGRPLAAVNGDFFDTSEEYGGAPRDVQIFRGELVRSPAGHSCFWFDSAGSPQVTNVNSQCHILWPDGLATPFDLNVARPAEGCALYTTALGATTRTVGGTELILEGLPNEVWLPLRAGVRLKARVRAVRAEGNSPIAPGTMVLSLGPKLAARQKAPSAGATLEIIPDTLPSLAGVETALGGGPTLVRNGKAASFSGIHVRTPRSALGWNHDYFFLVEVDGRQRTSVGFSFPDFANYLVKLGCEAALNLDGGGSSTMWVEGTVVNSPSEGRERASANSIVVVQTAVAAAAK